MKKLNFQKSRFWYGGIIFGMMGILVLAACGSKKISPNTNEPNDSQSMTPDSDASNLAIPISVDSNSNTKKEASVTQRSLLNNLLSNSNFTNYLHSKLMKSRNEILHDFELLSEIKTINQKDAISLVEKKLGGLDSVSLASGGDTAFAYLNQLKKDTTKLLGITQSQIINFNNKFESIVQATINLKKAINLVDDKLINVLLEKIKIIDLALQSYFDLSELNSFAEKWNTTKEAFINLERNAQIVISNLKPLIESAQALKTSASNFVDFINLELNKFIEATDINIKNIDDKYSTRLNNFIKIMQTEVIEIVGKDFGLENTKDIITPLHKVKNYFFNITTSLNNLNQKLKTFNFYKALTLKEKKVINLLAININQSVNSDLVKLKTYPQKIKLLFNKNHFFKHLTQDYFSLEYAINDLINNVDYFKEYFISDEDNESKLNLNLKEILNIPGINNEDKKVIMDFQLAFKNIEPIFYDVYRSYFNPKLKTSFIGSIHNLIKARTDVENKIQLAEDLGSVMVVEATIENFKTSIQLFGNNLPTTKANNSNTINILDNFEHDLQWIKDFFRLLDARLPHHFKKNKNLTNSNLDFFESFKAFYNHNFSNEEVTKKAKQIATVNEKQKYSGELMNYIKRIDDTISWFQSYNKEQFKPILNDLTNMASNDLILDNQSSTFKIINNLAEIYNNN